MNSSIRALAILLVAIVPIILAASTTTSTTTTTSTSASTKIITSWIATTGTGYGGYTANVKNVYYNSTFVWILTNSIPSYTVGEGSDDWGDDPYVPTPQNATYRLPRYPSYSDTKTKISMGAMGFWKDGVGIFNPSDGYSYKSLGVWNRNAYYWEGVTEDSFDSCYGHPDVSGYYHNHVNPICMSGYNYKNSSYHSPLIGFLFDGYPIYGPYGYSSAYNSSSAISRMRSGYSLRSITSRTTLANGTTLSSTYYGPTINTTYPLGAYMEDYEWLSTNGDLDEYNGRWCVTPEYPNGIYAYFVTINSDYTPAFPLTLYKYYYGQITDFQNTTLPSTSTLTQYF